MAVKRKVPLRKCVGCGEMKPKKEMLRILRTEEEGFLLDATGKKNGRGAYLCHAAECFQKAVRAGGWNARSSRRFQRKCMNVWKRR